MIIARFHQVKVASMAFGSCFLQGIFYFILMMGTYISSKQEKKHRDQTLSDILRNIFNGLLALTKLPSLKRCNILLNWLEISSPFGIEIMLNAFSVFAENENLMIGRLPRNSSSTTRTFILL